MIQHRISYEWNVSKKLLEEGFLTIGYRALCSSGILEAKECFDKFDAIYHKFYNDSKRNQVYRFANLKEGDTVVVPLYNGEMAIVEVCGTTEIIDKLPEDIKEKVEFEDADVIAEFDPINVVILVQVKAHEGEEDDWAVRQIERYVTLRTDSENDIVYIPWVISTADNFSQDAIDMAAENGVKLIDGLAFAVMLIDVGIDSINSDLEFN